MHCYECEKPIITVPAAEDFFIYDFKIKAYWSKPAIIIECPHCRSLLILVNYTKQDLAKYPIDERLQIDTSKIAEEKTVERSFDGTLR